MTRWEKTAHIIACLVGMLAGFIILIAAERQATDRRGRT